MPITVHNAPNAPQPAGGYAQVVQVSDPARLAFVSGQIPVDGAGNVPEAFGDQARATWRNLEAQLVNVGMTLDNLVKATVFLSSRSFAMENRAVRTEILGDRKIAMTVIICDIFDPAWLLEIEAIAAE